MSLILDSQTPRTISHFAVEDKLGEGAVGVVYRASDLRLGRRVALKFLRPEATGDDMLRRRFIQEARAASTLDHPNICTIFEVDETAEGDVFMAMAHYDGETLDRVIARGPLDLQRAISIAIQIGRGLAAAHEELLVHRDIKPSNVMVARGGTVKILDFGLALLAGHRVVAAGEGTPFYMSPEQLRGEPVDQRSDIWSFGIVLYEMLGGFRPFRGETVEGTIQSILHAPYTPLSEVRRDVPSRIDKLLERALAKESRLRFERVEPMVAGLLELQGDLDAGAATGRRPEIVTRSSIAVLPFEDMSAERNQGYLCDGIAEEILRALTGVPHLFVASRTSAFQFKKGGGDIREIGAKLNVDTVLEGSVRRAGDRVRISAQLINVSDGYRLWYERFDRDIKDIFAIEDEIAERIAEALQVTLLRKPGGGRDAGVSSNAAEAYQLFLQGMQFVHQHRRKAFEIALQTFQRAIEIEPKYARAYAGIANCNSFLRLFLSGGEAAVEAANRASARAVELDPDLADARAARGYALFVQGHLDDSERELKRAIELEPQLYDPHYISGRVAFQRGHISEAAAHFRQACSIAPEAYDAWYLLGMCYRRLGDSERAHSTDLECIEGVKKRVRLHPDDTRAWTMGAASLAEIGEPDRAAEWVGRAISVDADEPVIQYNATCVYVMLHRFAEALACLEVSANLGGLSRAWAENDPDLDPLRDEPRFKALLARLPSPA